MDLAWLPGIADALLGLAVLASTAVTVFLLTLPTRYERPAGSNAAKEQVSVQVLVLGDIGRSPRMQYHAISIAKRGGSVEIVGYAGGVPHGFLSHLVLNWL